MSSNDPVARLVTFVFAVGGFFAARAIRLELDLHGVLWGAVFGAAGAGGGAALAQLLVRLTGWKGSADKARERSE